MAESLHIQVDADEEVQAELDEVEVLVESHAPGSDSWNQEAGKSFNPDPSVPAGWPLQFTIESAIARASYRLTATARDQAGAITIQARAILEPQTTARRELRVRFDRECLRRSSVCGRTLSCSFGECVDAREPLRDPSTVRSENAMKLNALTPEQMRGAAVAQTCPMEDARTCTMSNAAQPLLCQQGSWQAQPLCPDMARCDSAEVETHGTCQPLAPECMGRTAGALFCDADGGMHRCEDTMIAHVKPCGDNEHCVDVNHDVRCSCLPGFIPDALGCVEARDCTDSGGCDPLTKCEMRDNRRVCTPCPKGFVGSGEAGCAPRLDDLQVSPGVLEPAFDPNIKEYRLRLPLLVPKITVIAHSESGASLSINNDNASLDSAWESPVLAAGMTTIPVVLRGRSVRSDYQIIVDHEASERTYFKGTHCQRDGWFGEYFSVYGNTLVVGAPLEAAGNAAVESAGNVYVYVREHDAWRLQQAIPPPEPVANGSFGMGVHIWQDRIAVGAPGGVFTVLGTGNSNGAAYTYVRNGDSWSLEQTIASSNSEASGDAFGFRVALRDKQLIISAPFDDQGASVSGAVYSYAWDGSWQLQQRIKQENPVAQSHYGVAVATDGDNLVIGATHETINGSNRAGATYVYGRKADASGWSLTQRLLAPTVRPLAQFGYSVATLGDTLIIAAPHNPAEVTSNRSGEVHIFKRDGDGYRPVEVLEATEPSIGDYFGNSVSLNTSWLAVGATRDATDSRAGQGKVYLYGRSQQMFSRATLLHADNADAEDHFGDVVALTDDYIAIGVREEDGGACGINSNAADNSAPDSGAVYVFR